MSEVKVERFLAVVEAGRRGDVEGALRFIDAQVDFVPLRAPVEGSYVGHDGIRRFFADSAETFDLFEPTYSDVRDLGDLVLALGTLRTRGKGSGVETEVPSAVVTRFRDGRMVQLKDYGDPQLALTAAGLAD